MTRADVLVVSLGTTAGWRNADALLTAALERAGARVAHVRAAPVRQVRTFMLTDLVQARATRAAALRGIAAHDPRAIVYSSSTAALLAPRPGAIWFDAPAADNRPGRHGLWQRPVEARRMAAAPLLLPMSEGSLDALPAAVRARAAAGGAVVLPVPIDGDGAGAAPGAVPPQNPAAGGPGASAAPAPPPARDVAALAYAADAVKKGLERILAAWAAARRPGETLLVAGQPPGPLGDGAEGTGLLAPPQYRALLRRARVFVAAPLREDHGIAQLEALADGCRLVTTPSPGPYPALALARALDARCVDDDLASAIRTALDAPVDDYAARAAALLAPHRRAAFDATVRDRVLPALLGAG